MHLMACIFLLVYSLQYIIAIPIDWLMLCSILFPAIAIATLTLIRKQLLMEASNNRIFRILECGLLLMGSMHFLQKNQLIPTLLFSVLAIAMILLLKVESRVLSSLWVVINPHSIGYQTAWRDQSIPVSDIQQLTLKNDYLGIHFRNGKRILLPVDTTNSDTSLFESSENGLPMNTGQTH